MSIEQIHEDIREKHILGPKTRALVIRSDDRDDRDWLSESPVCETLQDHLIAHCGIMYAVHPFEVVRVELSGTFFFACFEGEGLILVDGGWRTVGAGQACLQPPFIPNALKARAGKKWNFCWVRYQEAPESRPMASIHSPAVVDFKATALRLAIEGLHAEAAGDASPHTLRKWGELVHGYVASFAQPFRGDSRLLDVWQLVEEKLDSKWSLDHLSQSAHMSKEHLRRLCSSTLGRSPMQHLAFLRMHHAAQLLATTDHSIAAIARQVGYKNQFAFSDTFQRWIGCRPSAYRTTRS